MGFPGSQSALEELMCLLLGDLLQSGHVMKLADDLYIGANDPASLHSIWSSVLGILSKAGIGLSAAKTVICPSETTILGWVWSLGSIRASPIGLAL